MKKHLTIMADYCSSGLWLNGLMVDIEQLPKKIFKYKDELENWMNIFESFHLYSKSKEETKLLYKSTLFKEWLKDGLKISKKIRKNLSKKKYVVEYFNEKTNERKIIK